MLLKLRSDFMIRHRNLNRMNASFDTPFVNENTGTNIVIEAVSARAHYSCCNHEQFPGHKEFTRHLLSEHFLIGMPSSENQSYFCTACTQEKIIRRTPKGFLSIDGKLINYYLIIFIFIN